MKKGRSLRFSPTPSIGLVRVVLLIAAGACLCSGQDSTAVLHGTVVTLQADGTRLVIPGAAVTLRNNGAPRQTTGDDQGQYSVTDLPAGIYAVEATAPGLTGDSSVEIAPGASVDLDLVVRVETVKESITVSASAEPAIPVEPEQQASLSRSTILSAPSKDDRVDTLLPMVPGVVRGPDGLINMKGARSSQSGSLVNSASIIDPVTGNPAMNLPTDVVSEVKVIANPYAPEYGRLSGAVSRVETVTGRFDSFHASVQNILVRPRKRGGDFVGIESATPRATITGPLIKDKIAFTESFEYRFIRTPVSSLPPLQRDMKFEGFTSFNQLDVNLTSRQSMTVSFTLYPQRLNYLGLNTFQRQPSTPDLHQRGYMASIQHRKAFSSDSMLISQLSYKRFDADVTANSNAPYELYVETTTGGFFDRQARDSEYTDWQETYQLSPRNLLGSHQLKLGVDYAHDTYDGRVALLPVTVMGVSNFPIEQIRFGTTSRFNVSQNEVAWFASDKWQPTQRLTVDLGLRFDRDSITDSVSTAPRAGFAYMLTKDAKTVLKGGGGLFYDRVPLNVASFPLLPDRTVSTLYPARPIWTSETYVNTIQRGLRNPRSVGWNVELDRQIGSALVLKAGFQQRNTARDFVLDPQAGTGRLLLSNTGRSFYRELQFTGQYKLRRGTLNASYVRSKAFGNLNDFNQFFGNNAVPVINPDGSGRLSFDSPNRFLAWGQWDAPFKLTVLPVLDVHTGFPYSRSDEYRAFVGQRNSERFPRFTSFDLQVTRPVAIPIASDRVKARIGFSVFNLFNHFNPRDVQSDVDSYRFGALYNGVGRTFRGKFVLEF